MVAAYAWWVAGVEPFTAPALVAVVGGGVAAMLVGARYLRQPASPADRRGIVVWVVLLALLAGWELAAYVQHPRADHPTLSSLLDPVLDSHTARAVALLLWLVAGADLARR